jgi:hypothetical protein
MVKNNNKLISKLNEMKDFFKSEIRRLEMEFITTENPTKRFNISQDKKEAETQVNKIEAALENINKGASQKAKLDDKHMIKELIREMEKHKTNSKKHPSSLEGKLRNIIAQIEQILQEHKDVINPETLTKLIDDLKTQVVDVVSIEKNMDAIRREITNPVKSEIEKSSKLGKFSFWGFLIGIVGGLLAILSIIVSFYLNIENSKLISSIKINYEEQIKKQKSQSPSKTSDYSSESFSAFVDSFRVEVKLGSIYTHRSGLELTVLDINEDNTVDLALDMPHDPLFSVPDPVSGSSIKYISAAGIGKIYGFATMYARYDLYIREIDQKNKSIVIAFFENY